MRGSRWGREKPDRPRRGRWSPAEVARLQELYGLRDDESIARELNRPVASVRKTAESLFPMATRTGPWTAKDVLALKRYLGATTHEVIARVLGRTPEEVRKQITELKRLQSARRWTQEEIAELKRLYGRRSDEDVAIIFGRSLESIRKQARRLCLAKDKAFLRKLGGASATSMPRWSADEIERLTELYSSYSNLEIAQILDRSVKSVVSKAHHLGLRKHRARLQEMGRENVSRRYDKHEKHGEAR